MIRTEHTLREERTRSCGCNKMGQSRNIKESEEEFEQDLYKENYRVKIQHNFVLSFLEGKRNVYCNFNHD